MEQFEVYIKNLEQTESFQLDITNTLETLITQANLEFRFPSNAITRILSDSSEQHILTPLTKFIGKKLTLEYEYRVPLIFKHYFLKDTTITTNALGSKLELEKDIKNQLRVNYNVRLIADPEDWGQRVSQKNLYEVQTTFFIFYQESIKIFTIDIFETFQIIKQYIQEYFQIRKPFQLFYNNTLLEEQNQYYQQMIPDNSELKIVFKGKISIEVDFKGTRKQFKISQTEKIDTFKTFLRKQFNISPGFEFNIEQQNGKSLSQLQDLRDNSILIIKIKDYKLKLFIQFQSLEFVIQVLSNQKIADLDKFCQSSKAKYFKGRLELERNKTFQDYYPEGDTQPISVQLPQFDEYEIILQNKYFLRQQSKIKVLSNQTIEEGLASLIPSKQQFSIYYNNIELNPKLKFQEVEIKDQDVLVYYLHIVNVGIIYNSMLDYFDLNLKWTGHQIKEFLGTKLKLSNFKLFYDEVLFPLDTLFETLYTPDLIFQIETAWINVKIDVPTFDTEISEVYDQKARIFDVKESLRKHFEIPASVGIFITYQNQPQPDNVQLQVLKLDTYPLSADFQSDIEVSFVNQNGELIKKAQVSLGNQLKTVLGEFCDATKVQCFHNNSKVNVERTFLDLNIQQNDKLKVIQGAIIFNFKNKGTFIDIQWSGNPSETLRSSFNKISQRQAKFYIDNIQLDQDKTISELGIRQNQCILYETLINVNFTRIKGSLICKRVLPVNTLLVNSLGGVCKNPVIFFYNNFFTDHNTSLQQLTNQDEISIAFEEKQQIITVFDELQQLRAQVNITLTLQDLIKKLKLDSQYKQFYDGDQQLQPTTKLYELFNEDNEIILYFREPNNAEQSLFLPSQMIKLNNLKIILIDEQTETRYNETIEKTLIVKDFIQQFQKKSGLKNIMLFYEGVEIEEKKSFEELKIPNEAEIELQY